MHWLICMYWDKRYHVMSSYWRPLVFDTPEAQQNRANYEKILAQFVKEGFRNFPRSGYCLDWCRWGDGVSPDDQPTTKF